MKVELILDGHKVEINKDIDFVLNKQYVELSDLTKIIVDYSKTISIPMTPANDELFNFIYRFDHKVLLGTEFIDYDPGKKIPMVMTFNNALVMEGYAVLNKVDLKERTYEVNLYGELGKIFSELKKKLFENYKFDNGFKEQVVMNIDTIERSFLNDRRGSNLEWNSADWTEFFGFAPQMYGKTDLIDTKNYEIYGVSGEPNIRSFAEDINATRDINYGDVYVGDGFDFNQYTELRTYMTRPYVYVDKLIGLVKNEINTGDYDGYKLELDSDWFNKENPYYSKLCYFPETESKVGDGKDVSGVITLSRAEEDIILGQTLLPNVISSSLGDYDYKIEGYYFSLFKKGAEGQPLDCNIMFDGDNIIITDTISNIYKSIDEMAGCVWGYFNLDGDKIPVRYLGVYDQNNNLLYKFALLSDWVVDVWQSGIFNRYSHKDHYNMWEKLYKVGYMVPSTTENTTEFEMGVVVDIVEKASFIQTFNFGKYQLNANKFRFRIGVDLYDDATGKIVEYDASYNYKTLLPFKPGFGQNSALWSSTSKYSIKMIPFNNFTLTNSTYRSGSVWTIYDILGNDFNPFLWLLNYVKKFRLFFDIDYDNRKIVLKSNYFSDIEYKHVDVDYSRGVEIEPIAERVKTITYGYKENESKKGKQYRQNWGVEYGDIDIYTGIEVNDEVIKLVPTEEGVMIPVLSDGLTYRILNSNRNIEFENILGTNKIVNTLDGKGEIQYFPFYAFRVENYSSTAPFYYLSDDSPAQKKSGKYTLLSHSGWDVVGNLKSMFIIPQFDNYVSVEEVSIPRARMLSRSVQKTTEYGWSGTIQGRTDTRVRVSLSSGDRPSGDIQSVQVIFKAQGADFFDCVYMDGIGNTGDSFSDCVFEIGIGDWKEDGWFNISANGNLTEYNCELKVIVKWEDNGSVEPEEPENPEEPDDPDDTKGEDKDQPEERPEVNSIVNYWTTFNVPAEVYNGGVSSSRNVSIYNRWSNFLDELYNVNNKKVICYVLMSFPEFIKFKFNQLFVIDNNVFLVNRVIDFNPNENTATKVELIQISDVRNLA